ncbi:Rrf2 family protein [Thioalkalivibrio sulfidiphilus HL-EbGr7]|uniref:Rrf2 family protein n=1 Tax=Thioalkalivibrio sulfidiphilus (strain HL-EbGR7) TaxID=396588 RepID=B8GRH8_THISH|nr:Rrf2 family transcriptional regulator [Thioalkalivibrio sulfidiphilus]ACL72532.1 Rrf2 family protein [Thioalkalivibrio sulfidiphilus HL-EbGr7]
MQLTRHTDYALRVLIYLAVNPDRLSRITDIAEAYDISRHHLVKVVHELAGHGHILTYRGKHGGMRLARPPAEIRIGDVVRDMEENLEIINCSAPMCIILPDCRLKGVLNDARDAFMATLDRVTLAELVVKKEKALAMRLIREA